MTHIENIQSGNHRFPDLTRLCTELSPWETSPDTFPSALKKEGPFALSQQNRTEAFSQLWSNARAPTARGCPTTEHPLTLLALFHVPAQSRLAQCKYTTLISQITKTPCSQPCDWKEAFLKPNLPFGFPSQGFLRCTNTCM